MDKPLTNKRIRVGRLKTPGNILHEQGRVYRLMRAGVIETVDGSRLIAALGDMRKSSELAVVEAKLDAIEAKMKEMRESPKPALRVVS
jgi:hypothetical protein